MAEIWERQKGENKRSYIYYTIFQNELKDSDKKLQDVVDYIQNLKQEGDLKEYKGNLIKVPTKSQIEKLSAKWKWTERDIAYTNHLNELDSRRDEERYNKNNDIVKDGLEKDLQDIDEYSKELHESDYSLSTKVNLKYTLARAKDLTIKNLRLSYGRSTSISESNDKLKVDADVKYTGLSELAEAFNEGRKQYHKKQ